MSSADDGLAVSFEEVARELGMRDLKILGLEAKVRMLEAQLAEATRDPADRAGDAAC